MHQDYITYSKEDFLNDSYFVRSVKYPDASSETFWQKYFNLRPINIADYNQARLELEFILESAIRIRPISGDQNIVWEKISIQIPVAQKRFVRMVQIRNLSIAASLLLIVSVSVMLLRKQYFQQTFEIATPFAKTREVVLPDSSRIVLNANSNIKYAAHWKSDQPREIWLNGEAYFEVKHINKNPNQIKNSERFIVHTSKLDVQVLGTVFNVKARARENSVVLVSGKVAVKISGSDGWQVLTPGQSFNYTVATNQKTLANVDPAILTAWKDRSVILPLNTRLKDIIPQLEQNYGVHISLEQAEIGDRALEGTLPLTNQDNLFFILNNVLKIEISQKDSTWIFKPQQP